MRETERECSQRVITPEELGEWITAAIAYVTMNMLQGVWHEFHSSWDARRATNGAHTKLFST
jgi:hypothetical protein